MISKLIKTAFAICLLIGIGGTGSAFAGGIDSDRAPVLQRPGYLTAFFGLSTTALPAPPGMVPIIVYVPAQQMRPATAPPHTHAPTQATRTIEGTHCSINDVAVLTQDPPSCEKAGGKVVAEHARFRFSLQYCKGKQAEYCNL